MKARISGTSELELVNIHVDGILSAQDSNNDGAVE